MPNAVIKSFADRTGKTVAEVDAIWNETKEEVKKKFKEENPAFWSYVNKVVQNKLGLSKGKKTFKDFVKK